MTKDGSGYPIKETCDAIRGDSLNVTNAIAKAFVRGLSYALCNPEAARRIIQTAKRLKKERKPS